MKFKPLVFFILSDEELWGLKLGLILPGIVKAVYQMLKGKSYLNNFRTPQVKATVSVESFTRSICFE